MELLHTAHVPAGDGPLPCVLVLHGWGASAHDLLGLAPLLHGGRALVLAPQGPETVPIGPGVTGYGWFPLTRGGPVDPAVLEAPRAALRSFIDEAASRYPLDPNRLVVLGFSQGGVLAYDLFLREPERFAGLIALSTWLSEEHDRDIGTRLDASWPPALVIHGTRDPMVDVERGREARTRLLERKLPLSYREYEMGHEIAPDALREMVTWLEDKVLQPVKLL